MGGMYGMAEDDLGLDHLVCIANLDYYGIKAKIHIFIMSPILFPPVGADSFLVLGQFGRRRPPRSRSPPPDRNIDRYVPDPARREDRLPRDRGDRDLYAPPGSAFYQPKPGTIDRYVPNGSSAFPSQPPLLDPHKLDHQVTFAYFSDWLHQQPPSPSRNRSPSGPLVPLTKDEIKVKYDAYREEFNTRMAKVFVLQHMTEEWFKEKYLPGERESVRKKIVAFRQSRYDGFVELLEEGKLDGIDREGVIIRKLFNGSLFIFQFYLFPPPPLFFFFFPFFSF